MNSRQLKRLKKISRRLFWLMGIVTILASGAINSSADGWLIAAACLTITISAAVAYLVLLWLGQAEAQRELSDLLGRGQLQDASGPPIFLFLRSFDIARSGVSARIGAALLATLSFIAASTSSAAGPSRFDAEEELDDVVGTHGMFLAIGNKLASFGSAKLVVDDKDWKQTFFSLSDAAKMIFMMPGPSQSVLWELSQVLSSAGLLAKTVFIMPRLEKPHAWFEFAAMALHELNLKVPFYNSEGCCFRLRPDDRSWETADLEAFTRTLTKYLKGTPAAAIDVTQIFKSVR
jgi:hypothetical protein